MATSTDRGRRVHTKICDCTRCRDIRNQRRKEHQERCLDYAINKYAPAPRGEWPDEWVRQVAECYYEKIGLPVGFLDDRDTYGAIRGWIISHSFLMHLKSKERILASCQELERTTRSPEDARKAIEHILGEVEVEDDPDRQAWLLEIVGRLRTRWDIAADENHVSGRG